MRTTLPSRLTLFAAAAAGYAAIFALFALFGRPGLGIGHGFYLPITTRLEGDRPFALLVADLDDLGAVNTAKGRDAGDDVLRTVADRLAELLPTESDVARVGGDEFAILVPCGTLDEAADLAA